MPKAKGDSKTAVPAEIGAREAKRQLSVLLSRVGFGDERIIITRNGNKIAAIVPIADLERLNKVA